MDNNLFENQLNKVSEQLKATLTDIAETIQIAGMLAKDELDKQLADAKGTLASAQENVRLLSEKSESKLNSNLLRMQMEIDAQKAELEAKKAAKDKAEREEYAKELLEYADACKAAAVLLAAEANTAILEAKALVEEE